jgi:hypothetical protein
MKMQQTSICRLGDDKKAIEILKEVITKLNPKTGKAEYLLGIIYIGMERKSNRLRIPL